MRNSKKNTKKSEVSDTGPLVVEKEEQKKSNKKPLSLIVLIIIALVTALAFYFKGIFIAAMVNGQPISRLMVISELEKQGGLKTLESLITKALIFQEAKKNKIVVSDKDIDNELKKIESQVASQGQNLDQILAAQGMNKNLLKEQIRVQKIIEKILGNKIVVTDKEVDEYIQSNQQSLPENLKGDELKKTVKLQIQQQKLSQEFQKWIEDVRKKSKISTFVSY